MFRLKTIAVTFTLILTLACKQQADGQDQSKKGYAPEAVKANFQKMYPGENDPDWHVDAHGYYESHFKIKGVKHRADYNEDGSWVETEVSIDKDELPKAVQDAIKQNYSTEKITEIERVNSAKKGLFYDVEFKRKGKNMDVEFNEEGKKLN